MYTRPTLVLVCGGRGFMDRAAVDNTLDAVDPLSIIQGGCRGADTLAREWAERHGIPCHTFAADWETHGKRAGPMRNKLMLDMKPDIVIAFGGGRGTKSTISLALQRGIFVMDYQPEDRTNQ